MKFEKNQKIRIGIFLIFCFLIFRLTSPAQLFDEPTSYTVTARDGSLLSAAIASDGQWRFPQGKEIPEKFKHSLIQFEDKRFFWHPGIDPLALGRAIRINLKQKKVISGASTISMQVIRMSRQKERTIWQKLIEIVLALRLELTYSKENILKLYAGNAPFGGNVVGLEAASWRYFGRSPETLSWAEAATLAVLPNAPTLIHPGKNREELLNKRNNLLDKLAKNKIIDLEMAELSKTEPLPDKPYPLPQDASHLLERYKKEIRTSTKVNKSTRLHSTINQNLQSEVTKIIQRHHLKNRANGILNASALVLDVDQGEVLAYVGNVNSTDADAEPYVDMITALRSPGSTLKPLLYAAMLHDGIILPETLIADIPTQIGGYTPQNFDLGYDGAVPAATVLKRSLNIPMVKMLQQYKYPRFYQFLKQTGITSLTRPADHYGLSMILGGCEVSMWELAGTYASMARTLKHYEDYDGQYEVNAYHPPVYDQSQVEEKAASIKPQLNRSSVLDHAAIYFTFQAMNEVVRPESEALWEQFSSTKKIAWKTGTSFGFRDGWAIGLTPEHVVCIWVGNADGEGKTGLTGIETAAPILFEVFNLLPNNASEFPSPTSTMIQTAICSESGHLAGPNCPHAKTLYVPASGFKSQVCPYHKIIHTDQSKSHQLSKDCASEQEILSSSWFVLPPAMEYYFSRRHASYQEVPPFLPGCSPSQELVMEMIYPRNNAKIYIPLELDGKKGRVIFTVAHQRSNAHLYWHLQHEYIGETTGNHQLALDIEPGKHQLTIVDNQGNSLTQYFEILEKNSTN